MKYFICTTLLIIKEQYNPIRRQPANNTPLLSDTQKVTCIIDTLP